MAQKIGKIARPSAVLFGEDLPKTRSGKIMRRLLKNIAEGDELGDTTTLRDPAIVEDLKRQADAALTAARGPSGSQDELDRDDDEEAGEELPKDVVRKRGRDRRSGDDAGDREEADDHGRPPAHVSVAVLTPGADGHDRDHRRERRRLGRELRQLEREDECRHEEDAAADAEHP